jgi:hypothetical protein
MSQGIERLFKLTLVDVSTEWNPALEEGNTINNCTSQRENQLLQVMLHIGVEVIREGTTLFRFVAVSLPTTTWHDTKLLKVPHTDTVLASQVVQFPYSSNCSLTPNSNAAYGLDLFYFISF